MFEHTKAGLVVVGANGGTDGISGLLTPCGYYAKSKRKDDKNPICYWVGPIPKGTQTQGICLSDLELSIQYGSEFIRLPEVVPVSHASLRSSLVVAYLNGGVLEQLIEAAKVQNKGWKTYFCVGNEKGVINFTGQDKPSEGKISLLNLGTKFSRLNRTRSYNTRDEEVFCWVGYKSEAIATLNNFAAVMGAFFERRWSLMDTDYLKLIQIATQAIGLSYTQRLFMQNLGRFYRVLIAGYGEKDAKANFAKGRSYHSSPSWSDFKHKFVDADSKIKIPTTNRDAPDCAFGLSPNCTASGGVL